MKKMTTLLACFLLTAIHCFSQNPVKKVLLEEFTTTMCGMCPPKSYSILTWHEAHPDNSVLVVLHSGFGTDSMTTTATQTYCSFFQPEAYGFAPAIMIDRAVHPGADSLPYMSVNGFDTIADRVITEPAPCFVNISGTLDAGSRNLSATVSARFVSTVNSADWRIMLMLVEDSVIGSGNGYDQKCYDASFANAHYPGQYNASTGYIEGYPHRYVLRETLTGLWGAQGIIPNTPVIGQNYSTSVNFNVPSRYNIDNLSLVAYVEKRTGSKNDAAVLNVNDVRLTPTFATEKEEVNSESGTMKLYPCPASEEATLEFFSAQGGETRIEICNAMGQVVRQVNQIATGVGQQKHSLDLQGLQNGVYFIIVSSGSETRSQKLILSKK